MKGNLHIAPHIEIKNYQVVANGNEVVQVELSPEQEYVVTLRVGIEIKLADGTILTINEDNIYYARVK